MLHCMARKSRRRSTWWTTTLRMRTPCLAPDERLQSAMTTITQPPPTTARSGAGRVRRDRALPPSGKRVAISRVKRELGPTGQLIPRTRAVVQRRAHADTVWRCNHFTGPDLPPLDSSRHPGTISTRLHLVSWAGKVLTPAMARVAPVPGSVTAARTHWPLTTKAVPRAPSFSVSLIVGQLVLASQT